MKSLHLVLASLVLAGLATAANAAFLLEIDTDGLDDGILTYNPGFSFGGDTTAASQSAASTAFGMTGGDSIFGGNGSAFPDEYLYSYSPDSEADNLATTPHTDLGDGNTASGRTGGGPGSYEVYATWPWTNNVSGGGTSFNITTAGDNSFVPIDQNNGGAGSGHEWIHVGTIQYTSGPITVSQTSQANTFVSMRAAGVLFERSVPEPSTLVLVGLSALCYGIRRRS